MARLAHELAAHRGQRATYYLLSLHAFSPRGAATTQRVVQSCVACQAKQGEQKPQRHTYRTIRSGYPFQRLSVDFVGPMPKTSRGNQYIFTVKDTFSKWIEAFPIANQSAATAARILEEEIFSRYGFPEELHSDQGTEFTSHLFRQVGRLLNIRITHTPAYHPQSNPVERAHRDLKAGLRAALETVGGHEWDQCLAQILFAFRCSPARGTGFSPFEVLFGRHPQVPLGIIDPPPQRGQPLTTYVKQLRERIASTQRWAREHLEAEVARQHRTYSGEPRAYQVGDHVWVYAPDSQAKKSKGSRKLMRPWSGPWVITRVISPVLYTLSDELGRPHKHAVPIDRLKPYSVPGDRDLFTPSQDIGDLGPLLELTLLPRPGGRPSTPTAHEESSSEDDTDGGESDAEPTTPTSSPHTTSTASQYASSGGTSPDLSGPTTSSRPGSPYRPAAGPGTRTGPYPEGSSRRWGQPVRRGRAAAATSSAGRTPYWQDRSFQEGDPDAGALPTARAGHGEGWQHRPQTFTSTGSSTDSATHDLSHYDGPVVHRSSSHQPMDTSTSGVGRRHRPQRPGGGSGAHADAPRRGHPPGARRRGRPRVEDPSVSYPWDRVRAPGRVERPSRSEARTARQRFQEWKAALGSSSSTSME